MDHQKKFHVKLAEFHASGGQMPDRHEWNFEEMLKGSGLEQKLQPKKTMFARKLFGQHYSLTRQQHSTVRQLTTFSQEVL